MQLGGSFTIGRRGCALRRALSAGPLRLPSSMNIRLAKGSASPFTKAAMFPSHDRPHERPLDQPLDRPHERPHKRRRDDLVEEGVATILNCLRHDSTYTKEEALTLLECDRKEEATEARAIVNQHKLEHGTKIAEVEQMFVVQLAATTLAEKTICYQAAELTKARDTVDRQQAELAEARRRIKGMEEDAGDLESSVAEQTSGRDDDKKVKVCGLETGIGSERKMVGNGIYAAVQWDTAQSINESRARSSQTSSKL
ncbi:unnamed protein product [Zymoseptoria tritici ST99CH_1A5]|uniref:Uncharacterized protein n=2 Tax=Zymoseptoria tritici TaxID=1047171 RepID=A0A2H1H9P5_ZYMTR|nr:unnamed protein product [Zymoseptoria tritici ST99CH_1E4]SMY30427.1 unnamed protein product [Zymoseptoria tritici ST99CH_1A5]